MILKIEDLVSSYGIINSMEFRRDELFVVNNEEDAILNLDGDALRQMLRPLLVVVAANDIERSQRGKLIENLLIVDVASVDDGVTAGDDPNDFRAEQAVRVGDNCYSLHEDASFSAVSLICL